jgi:hypothetical protein
MMGGITMGKIEIKFIEVSIKELEEQFVALSKSHGH